MVPIVTCTRNIQYCFRGHERFMRSLRSMAAEERGSQEGGLGGVCADTILLSQSCSPARTAWQQSPVRNPNHDAPLSLK